MPSAAELTAFRTALVTFLSSGQSVYRMVGSDGTTAAQMSRKDALEELNRIDAQLGSINGTSPMFVRGVPQGLR